MLFRKRKRNFLAELSEVEMISRDFILVYQYRGYYTDSGIGSKVWKRGTQDLGTINTRDDRIHIVDSTSKPTFGGFVNGAYDTASGSTYIYWRNKSLLVQIQQGIIVKQTTPSFDLTAIKDFTAYVNNLTKKS